MIAEIFNKIQLTFAVNETFTKLILVRYVLVVSCNSKNSIAMNLKGLPYDNHTPLYILDKSFIKSHNFWAKNKILKISRFLIMLLITFLILI